MDEPLAQLPDMAAYGVGDDWEPLPWSWAAARLVGQRNYWLVTADRDGRPHSMPVWGVWDDDEHRFGFSCAPSSRKARNLAANPRATVTPGDTVEVVSVEGRCERITGTDRAEWWIDRYLAKYRSATDGLTADFLRSNELFELTPERAFGVIEREDEFVTRATRWSFG